MSAWHESQYDVKESECDVVLLQSLRTVCEVGPSQWCGSAVLRTEPCRPASENCTSPHSLIVLKMIM